MGNRAVDHQRVHSQTLKALAVPSGGCRVYYTQSGGAFSSDGLSFTDEGVRVPASTGAMWLDASVVYLGSQGWLMSVARLLQNPSNASPIRLAASPDGMSWTLDSRKA